MVPALWATYRREKRREIPNYSPILIDMQRIALMSFAVSLSPLVFFFQNLGRHAYFQNVGSHTYLAVWRLMELLQPKVCDRPKSFDNVFFGLHQFICGIQNDAPIDHLL